MLMQYHLTTCDLKCSHTLLTLDIKLDKRLSRIDWTLRQIVFYQNETIYQNVTIEKDKNIPAQAIGMYAYVLVYM